MSEELKPCPNPWCKGTTLNLTVACHPGAFETINFRVACLACGNHGPLIEGPDIGIIESIPRDQYPEFHKAIESWNTRPTPQPAQRVEGDLTREQLLDRIKNKALWDEEELLVVLNMALRALAAKGEGEIGKIECKAEDIGADIQGPLEPEKMTQEELIYEVHDWRIGRLYRGFDRIQALKVPELRAQLSKCREALDKMILAATWFHEGPYGPSPDIKDLASARAVLAQTGGGE